MQLAFRRRVGDLVRLILTIMKRASISRFITLTVGLFVAIATCASAQLRERQEVTNAIQAGNWERALAITERVVKQYESRAKVLWGAKFGWYWYQKGVCELKLERWDAAADSFQHCYEKYPNPPGIVGAAPAGEQSVNTFRNAALKGWADAKYGLQHFEESATLYRRYLAERSAED